MHKMEAGEKPETSTGLMFEANSILEVCTTTFAAYDIQISRQGKTCIVIIHTVGQSGWPSP